MTRAAAEDRLFMSVYYRTLGGIIKYLFSSQGDNLMETNQDASFLDLFPKERKSTISNAFLKQVRRGITNPHNVIYGVAASCVTPRDTDILEAMADQPDLAFQYAENRIAYEAMPYDEKQKIKAEVQERSRKEWMKHNPPSEKQVAYLASLGYTLPVETMEEASKLIDERCRKS